MVGDNNNSKYAERDDDSKAFGFLVKSVIVYGHEVGPKVVPSGIGCWMADLVKSAVS